jgi:hypothetical protein
MRQLITAYDGTTKTATTLPFPALTAANSFDIDQFSYDSYFPLKYTGSQVSSSQAICYEMILEQLILPNQLVGSTTNISGDNIGGRLNNYPYVYVDFLKHLERATKCCIQIIQTLHWLRLNVLLFILFHLRQLTEMLS